MVKQKLNLTVNCSDEVCPTEISNCNNTINVDKIVTDNPQDFLNQLNELLQIGINQSRVGM